MLLVKWMQHHLMRTLGNWYNFSDFNLHVKFEFFRKAVTFTKSSEGLRQCTNLKSDSSGGGPHQPWRNVDSERGQVHLGCASVYLPSSSSTLHWSCTRGKASTSRLRLDVLVFLLVQLQLKSTAAKSRYNSASPRCTWTWPWWTWAESAVYYLVQLQLR